jgi:predicted Zn finger-like uncharacterized protein
VLGRGSDIESVQEPHEPVYNPGMNWITRCPSCTTVYQLGDASLHAAKGWLRCGACHHVFDSTGLVLRWSTSPLEPLPSPAESESTSLDATLMGGTQKMPPPDSVADPVDRIELDDFLKKKEDRGAPVQTRHAQAELAAFESALSSFKSEPWLLETGDRPEPVPEPVPNKAGLARFGLLSLVFLLGLHLAYLQRDTMVAAWPASEPVIRHVCQTLGCQISPLRDAEGMVIDSSSLVQRSDDHVLTWSVRNATRTTLGMTAIELSLMDPQGKLVLRTVILPSQAGAPTTLSPGQSWSGHLKVQVSPELAFSDYRLLSFYP